MINRDMFDLFMFFLIRDYVPVGVVGEALKHAEEACKKEYIAANTVTADILNLAYSMVDRFYE